MISAAAAIVCRYLFVGEVGIVMTSDWFVPGSSNFEDIETGSNCGSIYDTNIFYKTKILLRNE